MSIRRSIVRTDRLIESLERRALLAVQFTFNDADGDLVTVKLTGPGNAVQTNQNGLELTGTTAASALSISVKLVGAGNGRLSVGGGICGQANAQAPLAKFDGPAVDFTSSGLLALNNTKSVRVGVIAQNALVNIDVAAGQKLTLTATGNVAGLVDPDPNSPTDLHAFNIVGNVGSFFAAATTGGRVMRVADGFVLKTRVPGDMAGDFKAERWGDITTVGVLSARIGAQNPGFGGSVPGLAFGAIKAGTVNGAGIGPGLLRPEGFIKSISTSSWTGGGIRGTGIGTLKITGDFAPLVVNLQAADVNAIAAPFAIKTGTIGGTWNTPRSAQQAQVFLGSAVGTLKVGGVGADFGIDTIGSAAVKTLAFTGANPIIGFFEFTSIGTLTAKSSIGGGWTLLGVDAKGFSLGTLKAPAIDGLELVAPANGGVKSITAGLMNGAGIDMGFLGSLTLRSAANGTMNNSSILLRGADAKGFALKTCTVSSFFANSTLRSTTGNIDRLTVGSLINSAVSVKSSANSFDFDTGADLDPSGRLNKFTQTRAFAAGISFSGSAVKAGVMPSITLNGEVNDVTGGDAFGFGSKSFAKISMRNSVGAVIKPVGPTAPGNVSPLSTDFVFRFYA